MSDKVIVGRLLAKHRESREEALERAQGMPWKHRIRSGPKLIRGYWVFYG